MITPYILSMVFYLGSGGGNGAALTTLKVEYNSKETCMAAAAANREALTSGKVILATCTRK